MSAKLDEISYGIRTELRSLLRQHAMLSEPIRRFLPHPHRKIIGEPRFFVVIDEVPTHDINGLRLGGIQKLVYPNETVNDGVTQLAGTVWHIKDRLKLWVAAKGLSHNVEVFAKRHLELLVCADLINAKKHGESRNRSKLSPRLSLAEMDTSKCGGIEMFYDGTRKKQVLLVANAVPIPIRIQIETSADTLGEAVPYIRTAFNRWMPLIESVGVIAGNDPESVALRHDLFSTANGHS